MANKEYRIDRDASAVQGAVAVVKEMQADGVSDLIAMHQGKEKPMDSAVSSILGTYHGSSSPEYNTEAGGPMEVREAGAGHIERFTGIPASAARTLIFQQSGRSGLVEGFGWAANPFKGQHIRGLAPADRWPMVNGIAKRADIHLEDYDVTPGKVGEEICAALDAVGSHENMAVLYENFPHNPTGTHITVDDSVRIGSALDDINANRSWHKKPILMRIIDNPYFMACPLARKPSKLYTEPDAYLDSGYQGTLFTNKDAMTPWIAVISFSKALGTASPGLHAIVASHDTLAAKIKKAMTEDDAVSYDPAFLEKARIVWSPENDGIVLEHYGLLREKYKANRAHVERILGDVVVPGDPGMTCLIEVPGDEYDFFDYLASEFHVAVVPNGKGKVRLALREDPDTVLDGVERIREAIDTWEPPAA